MESRVIRIPSKVNSNVVLRVIPGHFATTHSHINNYVDMTFLKARKKEAEGAAKILARDFTDKYSLIYGHHMADHLMFGDLDLYKDEEFFNENKTGVLILPDRIYDLKIIGCLIVPANDKYIFDPRRWQTQNTDDLLQHAGESALQDRKSVV